MGQRERKFPEGISSRPLHVLYGTACSDQRKLGMSLGHARRRGLAFDRRPDLEWRLIAK